MALSIGFRVLVSLHPAIQATGRLALAPTGLAPARRTCLLWTRDYLVRPLQHQRRDREAERLRCLQTDDKLECRRPFDRKIRGLRALQDPVHVNGRAPGQIREVRPIANESPRLRCRRSALPIAVLTPASLLPAPPAQAC